jgi:hypothetical protein
MVEAGEVGLTVVGVIRIQSDCHFLYLSLLFLTQRLIDKRDDIWLKSISLKLGICLLG